MPPADRLLPRDQQGARSQQLLIVLLGDYWHLRPEPVPSAALVSLLERFEVTPAAARAAIQRLAKRGFLVSAKNGRATSYAVSPMTQESVDAHVRLLFRSHLAEPWDGSWTVVGYSLPEDRRNTRNALRERLRQERFGLRDGLWIRPGDLRPQIEAIVRDMAPALGDAQLTVFAGAQLAEEDGPRVARDAFDLDELAAAYRRFAQRWEPVAARLRRAEEHDETGILQLRTSLMQEWRELRHADPLLPPVLLGAGFPFERALAVCSRIYDSTGPAAEAAFRSILQPHDRMLAGRVSHHTFGTYAREV